MAETSCGGHVDSAALEGDWRPWCDDCHYAVRARLAEVEAERDAAVAHDRQPYPTAWAYEAACAALEKHRARAEAAEARLAEVLALCDDKTRRNLHSLYVSEVRAAARGEGDRPAEVCADCGHARDKHPTGLARYVVYCQGAPSSAEMCRCKRYSGEGDRV